MRQSPLIKRHVTWLSSMYEECRFVKAYLRVMKGLCHFAGGLGLQYFATENEARTFLLEHIDHVAGEALRASPVMADFVCELAYCHTEVFARVFLDALNGMKLERVSEVFLE